VTDEVLADQVDYYRRRAGEYDVTAYGDVAAARARIARLVAEMRPAGSVLEIACGTGLWTEALAGLADTVTAIDAAPEAVEIARDRVRSANVGFEVADVFSWTPGARFDVVFFSAWLSHVPANRFEQFWQSLRGLLAGDGRVLFIDEHVDEREKEAYVAGRDEVVERRLRDGGTFRVIKNFVDPERLELRLRRLGWDCAIRRDGSDWVCGEARLARWRGLLSVSTIGTALLTFGGGGDLAEPVTDGGQAQHPRAGVDRRDRSLFGDAAAGGRLACAGGWAHELAFPSRSS
jgi:2-polyprenyl-3-methyl-5-hydroxy-6-metoxy-1,4-benzoquinol methylase